MNAKTTNRALVNGVFWVTHVLLIIKEVIITPRWQHCSSFLVSSPFNFSWFYCMLCQLCRNKANSATHPQWIHSDAPESPKKSDTGSLKTANRAASSHWPTNCAAKDQAIGDCSTNSERPGRPGRPWRPQKSSSRTAAEIPNCGIGWHRARAGPTRANRRDWQRRWNWNNWTRWDRSCDSAASNEDQPTSARLRCCAAATSDCFRMTTTTRRNRWRPGSAIPADRAKVPHAANSHGKTANDPVPGATS